MLQTDRDLRALVADFVTKHRLSYEYLQQQHAAQHVDRLAMEFLKDLSSDELGRLIDLAPSEDTDAMECARSLDYDLKKVERPTFRDLLVCIATYIVGDMTYHHLKKLSSD